MSHTLLSAHNAINALALAAWPVDANLYLPLIYEGVPLTALQKAVIAGSTGSKLSWARVKIHDNLREQSSIGNQGNRKFENIGFVTVQIFTPDGDGRALADGTLVPAMRNAYEVVNSGSLWFRRVRSEPIGPDRFWWHTNVIADFCWLEIR